MRGNLYEVIAEWSFGVSLEYKGTNFEEAKKRFFELDAEKYATPYFYINSERVVF